MVTRTNKFMMLLLLSVALITAVLAQQRQAVPRDWPQAVQAAVREQSQGARLHELVKEIENGQTFYAFEFTANGRERTVRLTADGKVAEVEEEMKLQELPASVQATVRTQSQGARILGYSKEKKDGADVYELELKAKGRHKDITISADGAIVAVEDEVLLSSLPAAARAAIQQKAGKDKIRMVESVTKGGAFAYFEAQIKTPDATLEIKVNPAGELVN